MALLSITLSGSGGVLDTREIVITEGNDSAELSEQIWDTITDWILAPGDTIKIGEVA